MQTGFTLLELLIVITIIGILASITIVSYPSILAKAKLANALKFSDNVRGSLQPDMVAWWKFDEGLGTIAKDTWWNGLDGTIYGATWDEGIKGKALSFDGSTGYISVPDNNFLNPTFITITAWVYPTAYQYCANVVTKRYPAQYILRFYSYEGRIQGYVYAGGAWRACTTATNFVAPLNQWSYLVFTYDDKKGGEVYVNGKLGCSFNYAGTISTGNSTVRIGSYYTGATASERFKGMIDDVQIYSAALPLTMIQQLYAEGLKTHQNLAVK